MALSCNGFVLEVGHKSHCAGGVTVQGAVQRGDCPGATSAAASVAVAAASVRLSLQALHDDTASIVPLKHAMEAWQLDRLS